MELEQNGNSIPIDLSSTTLVGRDQLGLSSSSSSSDRTISRHHLSLHLRHTSDDTVNTHDSARDLLLSFEVIGKNPISVISNDGERSRVYKKSEKGVLKPGDLISLSIEKPNYFSVKRREGGNGEVDSGVLDAVRRRERRTWRRRREAEKREKTEEVAGEDDDVVLEGCGAEIGSLDITQVDPVKEFGFLERGHEFDRYPRDKIRHFKDWNWFLEDTRAVSSEDDEEDGTIKMKGKNKHHKNKKRGEDDDEEWAVESVDDGNSAAKAGSAKRTTLSTRSKDPKKARSDVRESKTTAEKKIDSGEEDVDNEEDETLGGFIVGDDDVEEGDEEEVLEEESEEQDEDEDDEESDVD